MPADPPDLSICIPTHNRADKLRVCLESVRDQDFPLRYELHLRDNASPDHTPAVFREVAAGRPDWHYFRNPENIGGRHNINRCTTRATGRYLLILGDDDWLVPGAFRAIHQLLAHAKAVGATAAFAHPGLGPGFAAAGGREFRPAFRWLRAVGINTPGFITAVFWERAYWAGFRYDALPKYEVFLPQIVAFLEACQAGRVLGYSGRVYEAGVLPTGTPDYGFYVFHALVDCYEYPRYYRYVLDSPRLDATTRLYVAARQLVWLRHLFDKLLFLRYNDHHYRTTFRRLAEAHGSFFYWPLVALAYALVFRTAAGGRLATRRWGAHPKIESRTLEAAKQY